jgi:VanZ family protein
MTSNPSITSNPLADAARYWLPVLAWMGLIFLTSSRSNLPSAPEPLLDVLIKKTLHFSAYGILVFWWWRALSDAGLAGRWAVLGGFLAAVLYACTDEFHQTFVLGRHGQLQDVLIDTAGAALSSVLMRRKEHASRSPTA